MYEKALLPAGVLSKLNDQGIHLESSIVGQFKRYTLTKTLYSFNEHKQTISPAEDIGICLEVPENTSIQETVRLINAVIPKMEQSVFGNKIYKLYVYKNKINY